MTEEMLGGQHQNDESDTEPSVRGEHTNAKGRCSSADTQWVCFRPFPVSIRATTSGRLLLIHIQGLPKVATMNSAFFRGASLFWPG
jgi:hypothetical protein